MAIIKNPEKFACFLNSIFIMKERQGKKGEYFHVFNPKMDGNKELEKLRVQFRDAGMRIEDDHYAWLANYYEQINFMIKKLVEDKEWVVGKESDFILDELHEETEFEPDVYNSDLLAWIRDSRDSTVHLNEALEQGTFHTPSSWEKGKKSSSPDFWELVRSAQMLEIQEVARVGCTVAKWVAENFESLPPLC